MTDRRTYADGVRDSVAIMQESASDIAARESDPAAMARAEAVAKVAAKVTKRLLRGQP